MNQAIAAYSAWLPPKGITELYAAGIPTIAGALHPPAKAVRDDGGWRITGQVPFASGCHHAQWLVMPAQEEGADTGHYGSGSLMCRVQARCGAPTRDHQWEARRVQVISFNCQFAAPQ